MSTHETQAVIQRAVTDPEYRNLLFNDPEEALRGHDLSEQEREALRSLPQETLDAFASQLETRISLSVLAFAAETFGGEAMGGEARGGKAFGGEVKGGEVMGGSAYGGEAAGGEAYGGIAAGGEATGGEAMGGEAMGGEGGSGPSDVPPWLERLRDALGFRSSGNAPRGIKYY